MRAIDKAIAVVAVLIPVLVLSPEPVRGPIATGLSAVTGLPRCPAETNKADTNFFDAITSPEDCWTSQ